MKKQILLLSFLALPIFLIAEITLPEYTPLEHSLDPEKAEISRIQDALHKKAEQNYENALLLKDHRREKYLKNAQTLSLTTQRLLVTPQDHEFTTKADVDRLNQEIAREKHRSSKLWFNSDKSGTLIKDLENLKMNLQKKQIEKILQKRKLKAAQPANFDEPNIVPSKNFKLEDIGSQMEDNPLKPKQNFDYNDWKNKLLEKKVIMENEQKQINRSIARLKKQQDDQQSQLLGIKDQENEIFKEYPKKTFTPEHIEFVTQKLTEYQIEARKIEEKRLTDFKFTTFGIHDDNERLQELKQQIDIWKAEQYAYDKLQLLQEQEKTYIEKIQDLQNQQNEHAQNLKTLNEQTYDLQSSLNNADFHLKKIDTYLNAL